MAAMKRSAAVARKARKHKRPTARQLFDWAQRRADDPSIGDAMRRFKCRQCDIEDAIDAADNDEAIPGAYLGIVVALAINNAVHELRGRNRLIEAYYCPDST